LPTRPFDELDRLGIRDNTIVFYIFGDNGSSAEGQNGTISELLAQNQIPNTIEQQLDALNRIGGLDVLGGPKVDNMYHAGWAWAGGTPFHHTKLIASHFGGTRNPMAISWPARIKPDKVPRPQFHHVNDIVPTIYEILGIKPPKVVDGFKQDPIDGTSMVYTFADPRAPGRKHIQYFDNNGSRGVYQDGWFASTFGPLTPWLTVSPGLATWDSSKDIWELYNLKADFSQAENLAAREPKRLEAMAQASGCASIPRIASRRPIRAGSSTRRPPDCRNSRHRASVARATTSQATPSSSITLPGCSTRWAVRPVASRCTWTRANSFTSTT
jgi:arylsulfatase A-like enzyme